VEVAAASTAWLAKKTPKNNKKNTATRLTVEKNLILFFGVIKLFLTY
jgi:hypothetical protein